MVRRRLLGAALAAILIVATGRAIVSAARRSWRGIPTTTTERSRSAISATSGPRTRTDRRCTA